MVQIIRTKKQTKQQLVAKLIKQKKSTTSSRRKSSSPLWLLLSLFVVAILIFVIIVEFGITTFLDNNNSSSYYSLSTSSSTNAAAADSSSISSGSIISVSSSSSSESDDVVVSYRAPLMYGTKSGKEQTAQLVKDAILNGFRHIVTGGYHQSHNETGVGVGWKLAVDEMNNNQKIIMGEKNKNKKLLLKRSDLFLQTCFVPWDGKDYYPKKTNKQQQYPSIQEQVHISIQKSLQNLQTNYIDAVLFHNFRAQLYPYDKMIEAWKVLEGYVDKGIIKNLGLTSIHDPFYLERIMNETRIKPTIIQNRFHSNRGYDINMSEIFTKYNLQIQRFWLLNGSSNQGNKNKDMAERKNLTPQQLLLAFVMSLGNQSCLVGTHNILHMIQDIQISKCYQTVFDNNNNNNNSNSSTTKDDDDERKEYAQKLGFKPKVWTYYYGDNYNNNNNVGKQQQQQQQQSCAEIATTTTQL